MRYKREEELNIFSKYEHFIAETNRKSVDDKYYRRAIRNDGVIVFDINYMCKYCFFCIHDSSSLHLLILLSAKIWYKEETMSPFLLKENATMLYSAYRVRLFSNLFF